MLAKTESVTTSRAGDFYLQDVRKGNVLLLFSAYEKRLFFLPISTSISLQIVSFPLCQKVNQSQANFPMVLPLLLGYILLRLFYSELSLYHCHISVSYMVISNMYQQYVQVVLFLSITIDVYSGKMCSFIKYDPRSSWTKQFPLCAQMPIGKVSLTRQTVIMRRVGVLD